MPARDLHSNVLVTQHIKPILFKVDADGTPASGIDTKGFDSCEFVCNVGTSGDTLSGSIKLELRLQHSDDNSAWTDVTSTDDVIIGSNPRVTTIGGTGIFGTIDAAGKDAKHYRIGYRGSKRYVRVFGDGTGTMTNGMPFSAVCVQDSASLKPTLDT